MFQIEAHTIPIVRCPAPLLVLLSMIVLIIYSMVYLLTSPIKIYLYLVQKENKKKLFEPLDLDDYLTEKIILCFFPLLFLYLVYRLINYF